MAPGDLKTGARCQVPGARRNGRALRAWIWQERTCGKSVRNDTKKQKRAGRSPMRSSLFSGTRPVVWHLSHSPIAFKITRFARWPSHSP